MATTVNSRFLAIGSREPNISAGWTIRVLDYKDLTSLVTVISEFSAFSFTQELNAPGTGSVTLDEDSPFWTAILENGHSRRELLDRQYVFEAWDNNVARFAWLGQTVTNTVIGEDETRAVTISGPGIAQVLSWAKVWRPGWPTAVPVIKRVKSTADPTKYNNFYRDTSYNDTLSAFNWGFPVDWSTMRMWYTVFKAAQRRGVLTFVKPMFTALKDSAKQNFLLVKTQASVVGEVFQPQERDQTLLDFLADCTGQDYSKWFGQRLEWLMYPGFKLDVRTCIGVDRSTTVRFFQGIVQSDERTRDREGIFNRVTAQDVDGNESNRTDATSIARWNIREQWNTTNKEISDNNLRNQIADRLIAQSKDEKDQWAIKVPADAPGRVPYRNFFVGDYVGFNLDLIGLTPTATAAPTKMRIMAITINVTADSTVPECELTLKSIIDTRLEALTKQITYLVNHPVVSSLASASDVSAANPSDGDVLVYNGNTKKWEATTPTAGTTEEIKNIKVFFSTVDPATLSGNDVSTGDFWFDTTVAAS